MTIVTSDTWRVNWPRKSVYVCEGNLLMSPQVTGNFIHCITQDSHLRQKAVSSQWFYNPATR